MKKGITETKELFKAIGILAGTAGDIYKDGEVNMGDAQHIVPLAMNFNSIKDGFDGASEIKEELKDLDKEELVELVAVLYDSIDSYEQHRKA